MRARRPRFSPTPRVGRFRIDVADRVALPRLDELLVFLGLDLELDFDLDLEDFDLCFVCLRAIKKVYTRQPAGQWRLQSQAVRSILIGPNPTGGCSANRQRGLWYPESCIELVTSNLQSLLPDCASI